MNFFYDYVSGKICLEDMDGVVREFNDLEAVEILNSLSRALFDKNMASCNLEEDIWEEEIPVSGLMNF